MPSLSNYFPGIQVNATEIARAETLAEQVLQAKYEDLDLREGTAIRDLVIRPAATLLAMLEKATSFYFAQNTLADVDDSSSEELVDSIMSNWFLYRNLGTKAVINARLYFARNKSVSLTTNTYFSPDGTTKFFPITNAVISASDMILDVYQNEYYFDLDLVAEETGTTFNIGSGSLLYFSNFDPFFLHAEINYLSSEAGNKETNTQFIDRAKNAISTRNLINNPSIISNLQSIFYNIPDILPIGYGDEKMMRDQLSGLIPYAAQPVLMHVGGCVDVYCRTPLTSVIGQYTTDTNGVINVPGPTLDVSRSSISGGANPDTLPLNIIATATGGGLTSSGLVATFVATSAHGFTTGDSITIAGATPTGYNGTFTITVTNSTTFTYGLSSTLTSPATGTSITASKPVPYTVKRVHDWVVAIGAGNMTSSGTTVTVNAPYHGFTKDRYITITGANQSAYNGNFLITETTRDTFKYVALSTPGASPATGTIYAKQIAYNYDIGFSDRNTIGDSILQIDFGVTYPSMTASINMLQFSNIADVQGYLDDPDNKVVAGDYLARGFNIYYLTINIVTYNGPSADAAKCTEVIKAYLDSLEPGALFVMADAVSALKENGIDNIQTPLGVTYKKYTRDMILPAITGTITDVLNPFDVTSVFYLDQVTTNNSSA